LWEKKRAKAASKEGEKERKNLTSIKKVDPDPLIFSGGGGEGKRVTYYLRPEKEGGEEALPCGSHWSLGGGRHVVPLKFPKKKEKGGNSFVSRPSRGGQGRKGGRGCPLLSSSKKKKNQELRLKRDTARHPGRSRGEKKREIAGPYAA